MAHINKNTKNLLKMEPEGRAPTTTGASPGRGLTIQRKGWGHIQSQVAPPGGSVASKYVGTGLWLGICEKPERIRGGRPSRVVGKHGESYSGAKGRDASLPTT